jgi:hypothetical protein
MLNYYKTKRGVKVLAFDGLSYKAGIVTAKEFSCTKHKHIDN